MMYCGKIMPGMVFERKHLFRTELVKIVDCLMTLEGDEYVDYIKVDRIGKRTGLGKVILAEKFREKFDVFIDC